MRSYWESNIYKIVGCKEHRLVCEMPAEQPEGFRLNKKSKTSQKRKQLVTGLSIPVTQKVVRISSKD